MARGSKEAWLTIGALSRATGIPAATLRTWERRYGVPASTRKPSGHRLYPQSSAAHLQDVRRALELGHRPAEILALPQEAIDALAPAATSQRHAGGASTRAINPTASAARAATTTTPRDARDLLSLATAFDRRQLTTHFRELWNERGAVRFLDDCAGSFLRQIAEARRDGAIGVLHEQFAMACFADTLRELRRPHDERALGPVVAATTFLGDQHEIGLLMGCAVAATRGWRVVYLGLGTPVEELAKVAGEISLEAVLIGVSPKAPHAYLFAMILDLRRKLPERVAIWVNAPGFAIVAQGVRHFGDYDTLDRHLEGLTAASRSSE